MPPYHLRDHLFLTLYKLFYNNAHVVPNGVDSRNIKVNKDKEKNTVVYLGTIEERFDIELLRFLAESFKDVQFYIIGPVWKSMQKKVDDLKQLNNINFLGRKSFEESQELIKKYSVGIIPHVLSKFSESNDPMKIYDYF